MVGAPFEQGDMTDGVLWVSSFISILKFTASPQKEHLPFVF